MFAGGAKNCRHVFAGFARPQTFDFAVTHDEQFFAERVGNRFGANGFSGARWPGEVEREATPAGMALAKTPLMKNQVVFFDLRQRVVRLA